MLVQASSRRPASAHVVVLGNEKGGAGKSTLAMHVAVALLNLGQRVATVDLDLRQKSLTCYIENRRAWAKRSGRELVLPEHHCVPRGTTQKLDDNETIEFAGFVDILTMVEQTHNFIVIDTAGTDTHLTRLAHSMANTLITPLNDSFADFSVLGTVDPETYSVVGESHYARMVREARQQRRLADGAQLDWVVVRNRVSALEVPQHATHCAGAQRTGGAAGLSHGGSARRPCDLPRILSARASPRSTNSTRRRWARAQCCRTPWRAGSS